MNIHRLELYGIVLAALLAICGTIAYVGQQKEVAKAGTTQDMGEQFRKQLQDDLRAGLATLDSKISAAKTPQAQAQVIREYMPYAVPQPQTSPSIGPVSPSNVPSSPSTVAGIPIPDAPSTLIITPDKFPQLLADIKTCKESQLKLDACEKQLPVLIQERDAWQKAAKGGSWLSRTKTKLIWLGIGAGAGYALSKR